MRTRAATSAASTNSTAWAVLVLCGTLLAGCTGPAPNPDSPETAASPLLVCRDPCTRVVDGEDGFAFEPMAAANPSNPSHIVVGASEHARGADGAMHRWNYAYVSRDGGLTFTKARIPGGLDESPAHPLFGFADMGDAAVAILPDGTVLFSGLALHIFQTNAGALLTGYTLYVARSEDGGLTYPEVAVVARGRGFFPATLAGGLPVLWHANDKNWIAAGPDGTALLTWSPIQFPPTEDPQETSRVDVVSSVSRDGGRTWSAPVPIQRHGGEWSGSFPLVTGDAMHVAFVRYGQWDLHVATSTDGGATWDVKQVREGGGRSFPNLAQNRVPDGTTRLFLSAGQSAADGGGRDSDAGDDAPVVYVSDDGGATWQGPLVVDPTNRVRWAQTAMATDATGTVFVGYYHADTEDGAASYRVVALPSEDAAPGMSLDAARLTPVLTVDAGLEGNTGFRGHYTGMAGLGDGAFATWVTGNGDSDVAGAVVTMGTTD